MKNKVVPKLRQEVKVKVDTVTSDDIKIYNTGKFQDFSARYIIKTHMMLFHTCTSWGGGNISSKPDNECQGSDCAFCAV